MNSQISGTRDLSFVLSGAAGLGIQTVEEFLCRVLCRAGLHVFASREYMSRVRGGNNSTEIRVGTKTVRAFSDRMDYLFPLTPGVRVNIRRRISRMVAVWRFQIRRQTFRSRCIMGKKGFPWSSAGKPVN